MIQLYILLCYKTITTEGTTTLHKENQTKLNNKTATYASVAASGSNHQQPQMSEHSDINRSLQLILTKITNIEGAFSKMNERVKKLENDISTSKNKQIWPTP
jgi:peptidoglycan hydrolase CwlO-like protein